MKIIKAEQLGMCFGVRDAIALAQEAAAHHPLTILGDLVHNDTVLAELRARGIQIAQKPEHITARTVMITAHGTSQKTLNETRARGFQVLEATCPLVHVAHRALTKLVAEGAHPVVIGKSDHVEVRGLTGDLTQFDVVLSPEDILRLPAHSCFGVIAQTTQPIARVRELVQLIKSVGRKPLERDTVYNVIQDYTDVVFEEDEKEKARMYV